jgi:hypothetical protein
LGDFEDVMTGTISAHPRGFGFVMLDEGGKDLRLSAHQMFSVLVRVAHNKAFIS